MSHSHLPIGVFSARELVLNCGATHVAGAEFRRDSSGKLQLLRSDVHRIESVALAKKPWAEVVSEAMGELTARHGWRGRCRVALTGQHTMTKYVRSTLTGKTQRASALEFTARQAIPCALEDVVWDHTVVTEAKGHCDLVIAATKREITESLLSGLTAIGLEPEAFVPTPFALRAAFRHSYPEIRERGLIIGLGACSCHLVLADGERFFSRTFGLGGSVLDQTIADALEVSLVEAEAIKRSCFERPELTPDERARLAVKLALVQYTQRLRFEIARTLALARERYEMEGPAAIFLTGGGANLPELSQMLAEAFSCRAVKLEATRRIEGNFERNGKTHISADLPAELVGLAAQRMIGESQAPNLLPQTRREAVARRSRRPLMAAVCALTLAAPLPALGYWHLRAKRAEENRARIEQRLGPAQRLAAEMKQQQVQIDSAQVRIEHLRTVLEQKDAWLRFLGDLQERLAQVQNAWLERLQAPLVIKAKDKDVAATRRVVLAGRLLDTSNPLSTVSPESYRRAQELMSSFGRSPFVGAVKEERFDNSQPGILRFSCVLELKTGALL